MNLKELFDIDVQVDTQLSEIAEGDKNLDCHSSRGKIGDYFDRSVGDVIVKILRSKLHNRVGTVGHYVFNATYFRQLKHQ